MRYASFNAASSKSNQAFSKGNDKPQAFRYQPDIKPALKFKPLKLNASKSIEYEVISGDETYRILLM